MQFTAVNPPKKGTKKAKAKNRSAGRRKWGSPAQRAAFARMIAARDAVKSTKTRKSGGTMPAKRKKSAARSSPKKKSKRTYARRGFIGGALPVVTAAGAGVAGIMLANQVIPRLPIPDSWKTPTGIGLVQVGIGVVIATVGRRMLGRYATPMGVGVATMGGVQLAAALMNRGVSGLGWLEPTPALAANALGYLERTPAMDAGLGTPIETATYG